MGREQGQGTETGQHPHPTADVYLRVAAVLVILTVPEVGGFYVPAFHPVLVPVLPGPAGAQFPLELTLSQLLEGERILSARALIGSSTRR